jgi:hypothetical protein
MVGMLLENPRGNYSFVKGIGPYSGGVTAAPGYEIEHVRLKPALPLSQGFALVEAHLKRLGRPRQAMCGMELRSPRPFSFAGFAEFNASYIEVLKSWDIFLDELNPVARTNVCPELDPPAEPVLFGFSYTVPSEYTGRTFVVAGAGELPEGKLSAADVIRHGERSPEAICDKARYVLGLMEGRMADLRAAWSELSHIDIYTIHDIHPFLASEVARRAGVAQLQGLTWFFTRPPIEGIEYEMDLRSTRRELVLG